MSQNDIIKNIVVSSRIRLARNVSGLPFPHKLDAELAFGFVKKIHDVLQATEKFDMRFISQMDEVEKRIYLEKHLVSLDLLQNDRLGAVMVNKDESLSIMLNEEDHIREQSIVKGFDLPKAYKKIRRIDDKIISQVDIAYDDNLGFLTSCPTNVGTGMRASVMMFLPALSKTGRISALIDALVKRKMTVRGIYGEGSSSSGFMYQISNRTSLGYSEEEIIENVNNSVLAVCQLESKERETIFNTHKTAYTDRIMRSKGILTNAYILSTKEFFERFADVKTGVALGIIQCADVEKLDDFLVDVLPGNLLKKAGKQMNERERDIFRAEYTRENLNKILD
jgi:protein arginine kinase